LNRSFELCPDVWVPRIINGGWQLAQGHGETVDETEAINHLCRLAQAGLTSFDCADIYTGVERLLGRFLKEYRQIYGATQADKIRIHTKFVPNRDDLAGLTRKRVVRVIDRSLQRLGCERLDLLQFHWWDYSVPGYVETALWLDELRQCGKIACLGTTNFDTSRLRQMCAAGVRLVSNQVQYSLLDRRVETDMVAFCRERGIHLLCYGSLAGGFLSDSWLGKPEAPAANRSLTKYRLMIEEFGGWPAYGQLLAVLAEIAGKHSRSMANVAAAWVLARPGVGSVIVGARNAARLADNLRAFDLEMDAQDKAALERILARYPGATGPVFGLEREAGGPHASIMKTNLG